MQNNTFNVFLQYVRKFRFTACILLLFCGIFAGVFSLYSLEAEAVIYAAGLCALCGGIIICIDFIFYLKKHRELMRIKDNIEILCGQLPAPSDLIEEDFCEMLTKLHGINSANISAAFKEQRESIDYYTTWVHQIKAPIAAMRLILQGMDTGSDDVKELLSELFRIEQYTEMVMFYSRLDSTAGDLVIERCSVDAIIRQAVRRFAPQLIRKKLALHYNGTDLIALTDEKWLLFIIEQIISNAVKYTFSGSVTIEVKGEILCISDTGIGIAAEDLPRIFEKGFTGYNGHTDKKATGIGLYLCSRAAKNLGHRLSVISKVGEGTTLEVDLSSYDKLKIGV